MKRWTGRLYQEYSLVRGRTSQCKHLQDGPGFSPENLQVFSRANGSGQVL